MKHNVFMRSKSNFKFQAKIFLPHSVGRSMYGVFDETGLLQYGQVFIQYSVSVKKPDGKLKVYTGLFSVYWSTFRGEHMFQSYRTPSSRSCYDHKESMSCSGRCKNVHGSLPASTGPPIRRRCLPQTWTSTTSGRNGR